MGRGGEKVFQTCTIVTSSIAVLRNAVVLILFGADTIDLMEPDLGNTRFVLYLCFYEKFYHEVFI